MINPYYVAAAFGAVIMLMGFVIGLGIVYVGLQSQSDGGEPFDVYPEEDDT